MKKYVKNMKNHLENMKTCFANRLYLKEEERPEFFQVLEPRGKLVIFLNLLPIRGGGDSAHLSYISLTRIGI